MKNVIFRKIESKFQISWRCELLLLHCIWVFWTISRGFSCTETEKVCESYLWLRLSDEIQISSVNVTVLDQTKMLIQVAVRSKRGWGLGPDLRHLRHVLIHWLGRHERSIGETIGESFVVNFTGPVSCQNKQS